jgi:hypothetical protein
MLDRQYWRAIYDDERKAFVVEDAGWIADEPIIEYRLSYREDKNTGHQTGVLGKWWRDDYGLLNNEIFTFGDYTTEEDFRVDVTQILHDAKQLSEEENLDYFLAITDVVKDFAFDNELQEDDIFSFEGIFKAGPEDAYSRREHGLECEERLHDHVERGRDECWRIHIAPVVDSKNKSLGWSVVVLLYPDLKSSSDEKEIEMASYAELLDLDHWNNESEARFSARMIRQFMLTGERVQNPNFAYMNDSEVFEFLSIQSSVEETFTPKWDVLEDDALRAFVVGERTIIRDKSRWHPQGMEMITEIAKETQLPLHLADQMYAHLLDALRFSDRFGENSPWHYLDKP